MDKNKINPDEWHRLQNALRDAIPHYNMVNKTISLSLDEKWRDRAIEEGGEAPIILEIGSGPGTLASKFKYGNVICLDPLPEMHKTAMEKISKNNKNRYKFIVGCAEEIPLRGNSIDNAYCSFSFRDFKDKKKGLRDIHRVLRNNGKLVILDAAKSGRIRTVLMDFYLNFIAPLIAQISGAGYRDRNDGINPWIWLGKTYSAFGKPEYYSKILSDIGFKNINIKFLSHGLAFLLTAEKP